MSGKGGKVQIVANGDIVIKQRRNVSFVDKLAALNKVNHGEDDIIENEEEGDDALSWIMRMRRKEQESIKTPSQKVSIKAAAYSSADLQGMKVSHAMSKVFADNSQQSAVLVLGDCSVLDDDKEEENEKEVNGDLLKQKDKADELVSLDILMDRKKQRREKSSGGLLSHYNEIIDNAQSEEGFIIGEELNQNKRIKLGEDSSKEQENFKRDAQLVDLSSNDGYSELKDAFTTEEAASLFSSSGKRKKNKYGRKITEDSDIIPLVSSLPSSVSNKKTRHSIMLEEDDLNILEKALSAARYRNLAKMKSSAPSMAPYEEEVRVQESTSQVVGSPSMVLSGVSEFLNRLGSYDKDATSKELAKSMTVMSDSNLNQLSLQSSNIEPTSIESVDIADSSLSSTAVNPVLQVEAPETASIIEEPLVVKGVGATLALLRQKGVLNRPLKVSKSVATDESDKFRQKQKWLAEKHTEELLNDARTKREKEKEREERDKLKQKSARGSSSSTASKDRAAREAADKQRDKERDERDFLKKKIQKFTEYKPDINLERFDPVTGKPLTPKEAFRVLSHKFHGKEPGKMKTEKRLKKLDSERLLNQMEASDTPLHMASALGEKQKQSGTAHVVLSIGNSGKSLPMMNIVEKSPGPSINAMGQSSMGKLAIPSKSTKSVGSFNVETSGLVSGSGSRVLSSHSPNHASIDSIDQAAPSRDSNVPAKRIFGLKLP